MSIFMRWLGVACFEIQLPTGEVIIIDPYLDNSLTAPITSQEIQRVDWIFITHGHFDHVLDVGKLASRLGSQVICSAEVGENIQKRLDVPANQARVVTAGETIKIGSSTVKVVKALHIDNRLYFADQLGYAPSDQMSVTDMVREIFSKIPGGEDREKILSHLGKYPPGEQLNYIFDLPGNLRLYFFGSVPHPELFFLVEEARPQILILQILRNKEKEAVELVRRSGAWLIFPSHHDPFFPGQKLPDMELVKRLMAKLPGVCFIEPQPGQWWEVRLNALAR